MAESLDEQLRARAKRAGVSLLAFKPGLSKLDPRQYEADLRAFGDRLARDLLPRLEGRRAPLESRRVPPAPRRTADEEARASVLRSALDEIERSPDPDLVAFLLLRAARSFFPRVILFVVKDERLRGLCGFGPLDSGDSLDLLSRELSASLEEPSPLRDAVARGQPSLAVTSELPALLAWERRIEDVRPFALDASQLLRFASLVVLALGSWLGGAIVDVWVERFLR